MLQSRLRCVYHGVFGATEEGMVLVMVLIALIDLHHVFLAASLVVSLRLLSAVM